MRKTGDQDGTRNALGITQLGARTFLLPGLGEMVRELRGPFRQLDFARDLKISVRTLRTIEQDSAISAEQFARLKGKLPELEAVRLPRHGFQETASSEDLLFKRVYSKSPDEADYWLSQRLRWLQDQYRMVGNPVVIYHTGKSLAEAVRRFSEPTYTVGQLELFLGKLLINTNVDFESIRVAQSHLENATPLLAKNGLGQGQSLRDHLRSLWLTAVALKMRGRFDDSLKLLRQTLNNNLVREIAAPVETIPLIRQIVLMEQTSQAHMDLERSLDAHKSEPLEHFASLKRLFEYSMNTCNYATMDRLHQAAKKAFRRVEGLADQISCISFYKNLYQYHRLHGRVEIARRLFQLVKHEARRLDLYGQYRQVTRLKELFDGEPVVKGRVRLPVAVLQ